MSNDKKPSKMVGFACPDSLRKQIDDYRYSARIPNEGETIRRLIQAGLERGQEAAQAAS